MFTLLKTQTEQSVSKEIFDLNGFSTEFVFCSYLQIRHLSVALLRPRVVRQLHVPEARQLVHQDGVLLYEGIKDVLWDI